MTAPKKYIKVGGVMKLNPEYKKYQESQSGGQAATTVARPDIALPVVSTMEDYAQFNQDLGTNTPLSESTSATIEMLQDPEVCMSAGMSADTIIDQLGSVLGKYEVPIGLMNKLMVLTEFQSLEFIIDDSGSMGNRSDSIDKATGRPHTRWTEAKERLKEMLEVLAYVPFNQIGIEFLNRPDRINLTRNGRDPKAFLAEAYHQVDAAFTSGPRGTTPAFEKLSASFSRGQGANIARYFFGDGIPNGGEQAQKAIVDLLKNRQNPSGNPLTFMSCTNVDEDVEWMKDAEEVAPYCSESDDFADEAAEVMRDQGAALPYTRGFHLICQLVAAMFPEDLDAMDESVPFTKTTLDNLLGIQTNEESYRQYFNEFVKAQGARKIETKSDKLKKTFEWDYEEFRRAPTSSQIPAVQQFKQQVKEMDHKPKGIGGFFKHVMAPKGDKKSKPK
ncbi:hypothetical protein MPSEU_000186000 [Mayamaea pseudoterrestris]|nr:hypothetical protein MPSEU_000186000 [Mayamaea pseudoterrestris]